jgi:excinuclease UvrABC ATPase subunit
MKDKKSEDLIIVKGARTHNLKDITVEMPRNKMIVFTGLSGSGKSSLAFDTIFAEGQRRYVFPQPFLLIRKVARIIRAQQLRLSPKFMIIFVFSTRVSGDRIA